MSVFNLENLEIVQKAVENQNTHFDGVVQYDYESGKLFGCSMSTGQTENPANPFIEVFRLKQGEMGEIDCQCNECPFIEGFIDEEHKSLYPATKEECCLKAYVDVDFEDDWEMNFRESVEEQVRDLISDVVSDDLETLSKIRLEYFRHFTPARYNEEVFNNSFESDVIDSLVEGAMDSEFYLESAEEYLSGDADHIANLCDEIVCDPVRTDSEKELASKVAGLLRDFEYVRALEVLQ